jgi:hypothetical protein
MAEQAGQDGADFVVLEPGGEANAFDAAVPSLRLGLRLAPGETREVMLPISEPGVGAVVDVLYRCGGDELVEELRQALAASFRSAAPAESSFAHSQAASEALRMFEAARRDLRSDAFDALAAVDVSVRRVFEHDLSMAAAALHPRNFGLVIDDDRVTAVSTDPRAVRVYRKLRTTIADLDAKQRLVRDWNFTIPPNAPTARRQFERNVLAPYCDALAAAGETWPALRVLGARAVKALADERRADVQRWAGQPGNDTRLDEIIRDTLTEAYSDLMAEQPGFRTTTLAAADAAMRTARRQIADYWAEPPEATVGRLHPLWQHAFVVHAAIEQQGLRPGDLGHAAATAALRAATASQARAAAEAAETERTLGWASLGFGIVTLVPVVGQVAVLALVTITAVQALDHAQSFLRQSERSQALGHQARPYAVAEPDATALICDLLSLTSDVALPVLGRALRASVLAPSARVIAAARVQTVLNLGERSADLAGLVTAANAAAAERELRRSGLLDAQADRP